MLVAAWVAVAVTVAADWLARARELTRLENVAKPAATVALAALALAVSDGAPRTAVVAFVVGFALCLAGDVALLPSVDRFIVGLGAFLAGHVAFGVGLVALGLDRLALGALGTVLVAALASTLGARIVRATSRSKPALRGPVVGYLVVISAMAVVAWSTGRPAALIGAALFVVSDTVLGWRTFVEERRWMSLGVMVTYHGALLGLGLSLA